MRTMRVAGAGWLLAAAVAAADVELVRLTVEEEAGAPRRDEPVTVGVPFAEGAVPDVARLALRDEAGKTIPAQFTEASRWRTAKGGVHWAHADFQMSVEAKGRKTVAVMLLDRPAAATVTPLKVTLENNVATVVTGPLKFAVRGAAFNGFDGAWYNPAADGAFTEAHRVIRPGGASRAEGGGKTFLSTSDAEGRVEIESAGPMKVALKASGRHLADGGRLLDYVVRFTAYANSPVVRVSHTFVNRQGADPADCLGLDALALDVPTAMSAPSVAVGTDAVPWTGAADKAAVTALQKSSDEFALLAGDAEKARGKGKSVKPLSLGWMDAGSGGKRLACGVRWFWQMHPKALSVAPDGVLSVGLYPRQAGKTLDVYMGQSRTHYLTFLFHSGLPPAGLNAFFAGSQAPLRPWAPPRYYCRDTFALGYTAESDQAIFPADKWATVQDFDRKMLSSLSQIRRKVDGHSYQGYTTDSYGFLAWGDTFHWAWAKQERAPKDTVEWHLSWEGNYYDYPNLCLMQALRTGNRDFYWHAFEPNTIHVRDVFTCQYHPKPELCGACRYCPPRNHVATDDGRPYVSNEFNHNKSQCVFAHWYLTGDWRTREVLDLMMNNALNNHAADTGFANRGIGAHLALLWHAWELTGEEKYRKRLLHVVRCAGKELEKTGGEFLKGPDPGIGQEGIVYAHWVAGADDEYTEKILRLLVNRLTGKERSHPSSALLLAYGAFHYGDAKARELAWASVSKASASPRPKDTAEPNRNIPFALYFLSNACPAREKPAAAPAR